MVNYVRDRLFDISSELLEKSFPVSAPISKLTSKLTTEFNKKYNLKYIISGTSRKVYDFRDEFVVKIPFIDEECIRANLIEYLIYKLVPSFPIAPTELYFFKGIPIVVMEKLDMNYVKEDYFSFAESVYRNFALRDGVQAAKDSNGYIKIYDAGFDYQILSKNIKKIPKKYLDLITKTQPNIQTFFDKYPKIT